MDGGGGDSPLNGFIQEEGVIRTDDMTSGCGVSDAIVRRVRSGFPIIFPTTNLPALGTIPSRDALDRLYELKERPAEMKVSLAFASLEQAGEWVVVPESVVSLFSSFPSGVLTVVLPALREMDERVGGEEVAVRIVECEPSRSLLLEVGPLTATSANPSGEEPLADCLKAANSLGISEHHVVHGVCSGDPPTTLIRCDDYGSLTSGEQLQVLREGIVSEEEVRKWSTRMA